METLHKRVAGIDVHCMKHVVTALIEDEAGSIGKHTREFGGFKRDLKALAEWLRELDIALVILESLSSAVVSLHSLLYGGTDCLCLGISGFHDDVTQTGAAQDNGRGFLVGYLPDTSRVIPIRR
jgi:hypothetical protein